MPIGRPEGAHEGRSGLALVGRHHRAAFQPVGRCPDLRQDVFAAEAVVGHDRQLVAGLAIAADRLGGVPGQHRHDQHIRRAVLALDHVGPVGADLFRRRHVMHIHRGRALVKLGQHARDFGRQRAMPFIGEDADPHRAGMAWLAGAGLRQGDARDHRRFVARVVEHPEQPMIGVAFRGLGQRVLLDHVGVVKKLDEHWKHVTGSPAMPAAAS